jgi:hypothetical protein
MAGANRVGRARDGDPEKQGYPAGQTKQWQDFARQLRPAGSGGNSVVDEQDSDSRNGWWADLQDPNKNRLNRILSTWQWFARSMVLFVMWTIVLLFWPKSLWNVVLFMPFALMMLVTYLLPLLLFKAGIAKQVAGWWLKSDRMTTIPEMLSRMRRRDDQ